MTNSNQQVTVAFNNTIDAEDAAKLLNCSYPHISMLLRNGKIKGQKIGKKWLVDADDVKRAQVTRLVTPRPRKNRTNVLGNSVEFLGVDEVEIRIKMPKNQYQLLDMALQGNSKINVKQHLESHATDLFMKLQKQFETISL
jgi:excisionase family DNA binding protein